MEICLPFILKIHSLENIQPAAIVVLSRNDLEIIGQYDASLPFILVIGGEICIRSSEVSGPCLTSPPSLLPVILR